MGSIRVYFFDGSMKGSWGLDGGVSWAVEVFKVFIQGVDVTCPPY